MRKAFSIFLVLALALTALSVTTAQDEDLSGTTVTVFGAYTDDSEVGAFEAGFADFEEETGIDVIYEGASDFEILVNARVEAGDPPDIAGFPQTGLMCRFSEDAIPVTDFLDRDYLLEQYNESYLDLGTCGEDGPLVGVWHRVLVKSLVWYAPEQFDAFGYEAPETWEELLELSDQIVADGGVPWAIYMESGPATGWVGTDWIEDILLRTAPLEVYDAWATPTDERQMFASDEVTRAFELFGSIALNEDYILGGPQTALDVSFFDSGVPLLEGEAFMVKQGSFMPGWLDSETYPDLEIAPDGDLWYFEFPPIDEEFGAPVLFAGDVYSAFSDRPEVLAVMEHLTKGESVRPGIEQGVFLSPHLDADPEWYRPSEAGIAEILLNANAVRFDGGDLMPAEVGTGSFWQGVVDYISGGDLDGILETIDESWPE